jgi:hypothetical protein
MMSGKNTELSPEDSTIPTEFMRIGKPITSKTIATSRIFINRISRYSYNWKNAPSPKRSKKWAVEACFEHILTNAGS